MPRPQKNNAEYFFHSTGLRNHRKIKALRNNFGKVLGYAFWCMMLEWLTEHDGLEWEFSELECEMFAGELGVTAAEIRQMVDFCLKIELLFLTDSDFVFSQSLNDNLDPLFNKRQRERDKSEQRRRREDGTFMPTNSGVSAAETPPTDDKQGQAAAETPLIYLSEAIILPKGSTEPPAPGIELLPDARKEYRDLQVKDKRSVFDFIARRAPVFIDPFVDFWNIFAAEYKLPKVKTISEARKRQFRVRLKEPAFNLPEILRKAKGSDFVLSSNWFSFDWILANEKNYVKVLEGNYDNKQAPERTNFLNAVPQ